MTVKEIVIARLDAEGYDDQWYTVYQWLKENGYDGLCTADCGCRVDDLMPCGKLPGTCIPGHKRRGDDGNWGIFVDTDMPVDERSKT